MTPGSIGWIRDVVFGGRNITLMFSSIIAMLGGIQVHYPGGEEF
jgi:hypothetical protein